MTPKFIQVTLFRSSPDAPNFLMINPRRINSFSTKRPPTQQPNLYCGTELWFGRDDVLIVKETVAQIKNLLA